MTRATRILNKYQILAIMDSDLDINFDNFYKDELINMVIEMRKELKNKNRQLSHCTCKLRKED